MAEFPKSREDWADEARRVDNLLFAERMKPRDKQRPFYMDTLYHAQFICKMAHDYVAPGALADGSGATLGDLVSSDLAVGARSIATDDVHRRPSREVAVDPEPVR